MTWQLAEICFFSYMKTGFIVVSVMNNCPVYNEESLFSVSAGEYLPTTFPALEGSAEDCPAADCQALEQKIQLGTAICGTVDTPTFFSR